MEQSEVVMRRLADEAIKDRRKVAECCKQLFPFEREQIRDKVILVGKDKPYLRPRLAPLLEAIKSTL